MPGPSGALLIDTELKRYAAEHDFRCGALAGANAVEWIKEQDIGLVSLPCMKLNELAAVRGQLSPIPGIGAGENKALANRPEVVSVNGVRLGFLSLNETTPRGGGYAVEADIEDLAVCDHVRMLLPQCDHVIVFCRAGLPDFDMPLPEWRERYRHLIEAGASVVLGVSSGKPSGWEECGRGAVFYGLGMLTGDSLAVSVTFERNGRFAYESRLLKTDGGTIGFSADNADKEAINAKNVLLTDKERYLSDVERACVAFYQGEESGRLCDFDTKHSVFSGLLRKKAKDDRQNRETALKNLLSGTSRRFAVLRALNAQERTKAGDTE